METLMMVEVRPAGSQSLKCDGSHSSLSPEAPLLGSLPKETLSFLLCALYHMLTCSLL